MAKASRRRLPPHPELGGHSRFPFTHKPGDRSRSHPAPKTGNSSCSPPRPRQKLAPSHSAPKAESRTHPIPHPRQKFTPFPFRTQGRRSAAARRVPPTTPRSCRRVPPAAWPASPGGGAGWALRQAPVQTARNQSHRGIGRQTGVTTPVKQVPLSPSCQCHYPRVKPVSLLES